MRAVAVSGGRPDEWARVPQAGTEGEDRIGAKWVTPAFQKDVFSAAWLSFLCLPLPEELHRKARLVLSPLLSQSHRL